MKDFEEMLRNLRWNVGERREKYFKSSCKFLSKICGNFKKQLIKFRKILENIQKELLIKILEVKIIKTLSEFQRNVDNICGLNIK